jgi:hypothetical protein
MPPTPTDDADAEAVAQQAADMLALALEDVGFDVGRAFPGLRGALGHDGSARVDVGRVLASTALDLAGLLNRASLHGITM